MIRPTKMLKFEEVKEDLGISTTQLNYFIKLEILNPIFLGKGWKFSQREVLDFQEKYKRMNLSNYDFAFQAKQKIDSAKSIQKN